MMAEKGKVLDPDFLDKYEKEIDWAEGLGIARRTAARYRALGLPYLTFGGFIWIPKQAGRLWIASRVKRRNVRCRRVATTQIEPTKEVAAA
jgi:hypothetical protein